MSAFEGRRTSISDFEYYLDCIHAALNDDEAFHRFKRLPGMETVEGVQPAQSRRYRAIVMARTPELLSYVDKFKGNDVCGSPRLAYYDPEGLMSPTTWRYIKVLSDLQTLFGSMQDWDVAEIGAGYGGQYKIIQDVFDLGGYTVYDLPPVMELIVKYLRHIGCASLNKVRKADFRELGKEVARTYDLAISNWALSECTREIQDLYIEHVLRRSRRGYITYNQISHHCGIDSYRKDEFLDALGFPVEVMDEGLDIEVPDDMEQFILYWHRQPFLGESHRA